MNPRTFVIADVHGCGVELQNLLEQKMQVRIGVDKVYAVGDMFDRGMYASLVWELIKKYDIQCILGNHEQKMVQYLIGKRKTLPTHYYYCLAELESNGVTPTDLISFINKLPRLLLLEDKNVIVTHGGIIPSHPLKENESANTYGSFLEPIPIPTEGDGKVYWWDQYTGDYLILYGHFVTDDRLPRIRHNSIGLDCGAAHGHALMAYCIETKEFFSYESGIDWFTKLKGLMIDDQNPTSSQ